MYPTSCWYAFARVTWSDNRHDEDRAHSQAPQCNGKRHEQVEETINAFTQALKLHQAGQHAQAKEMYSRLLDLDILQPAALKMGGGNVSHPFSGPLNPISSAKSHISTADKLHASPLGTLHFVVCKNYGSLLEQMARQIPPLPTNAASWESPNVKDLERALSFLQRALHLDPTDSSLALQVGQLAFDLQSLDDAVDAFTLGRHCVT
jgi:tetratricopeptide (TPR) repeat protein